MIEVRKTEVYAKWLDSLRDVQRAPVSSFVSSGWRPETQGT